MSEGGKSVDSMDLPVVGGLTHSPLLLREFSEVFTLWMISKPMRLALAYTTLLHVAINGIRKVACVV